MKQIISAEAVAKVLGFKSPSTVLEWARRGIVPSVPHGKQTRFVLADVKASLAERAAQEATTRCCSTCQERKLLDQFPVKTNGGRAGRSTTCRDCTVEYKRQQRVKAAERAGKAYRSRDEVSLAATARRTAEAAERAAKREALLGRPRPTKAEIHQRKVKYQRIKYATDPEYKAKVKAKKIRRKRALAGVAVTSVNHEKVAERDGWRCGICGRKVTRRTWSIDHVVPLSQGGAHTYGNVVLAHRNCNSSRGAGRRPVQQSLLSRGST